MKIIIQFLFFALLAAATAPLEAQTTDEPLRFSRFGKKQIKLEPGKFDKFGGSSLKGATPQKSNALEKPLIETTDIPALEPEVKIEMKTKIKNIVKEPEQPTVELTTDSIVFQPDTIQMATDSTELVAEEAIVDESYSRSPYWWALAITLALGGLFMYQKSKKS